MTGYKMGCSSSSSIKGWESQENHLCGKIICPFHLKFDCRKLAQLNKMFIKLWIVKASELKRNRIYLCHIMIRTHTVRVWGCCVHTHNHFPKIIWMISLGRKFAVVGTYDILFSVRGVCVLCSLPKLIYVNQ